MIEEILGNRLITEFKIRKKIRENLLLRDGLML
jgi:hypothetical protein